jgi:hypothetical protein
LRNAFKGGDSRFKTTEKTEAPKEIKIPNEIKEQREPIITKSAGFELKKQTSGPTQEELIWEIIRPLNENNKNLVK